MRPWGKKCSSNRLSFLKIFHPLKIEQPATLIYKDQRHWTSALAGVTKELIVRYLGFYFFLCNLVSCHHPKAGVGHRKQQH